MKLSFISHTEAGATFKVGSHHLTRELSLRGHSVAHISTPYSSIHRLFGRGSETRAKLAEQGPILDDAGVLHSVPSTLLPIQVWNRKRYLQRHLDKIGFFDSDYVVVDQPLMSAIADVHGSSKLIYRPTDVYPSGIARRRQRELTRAADAVVATSQVVLDALDIVESTPSLVIQNGVEFDRFNEFNVKGGRRSNSFIYVGALDDRFDWSMIESVARCFPTNEFDIYGPIPAQVPSLPSNVILHGPMDYSSVPALLAGSAVGLLPLARVESNQGRSPMKLYEYLAAGLPVVARSTPGLEKASQGGGLHLYSSPDSANLAAAAALEASPLPSSVSNTARAQDWTRKCDEFLAFIESI